MVVYVSVSFYGVHCASTSTVVCVCVNATSSDAGHTSRVVFNRHNSKQVCRYKEIDERLRRTKW
jgi:hypothetical protein